MTLTDAILSLFPHARFGTDFMVSETFDREADKVGPEAVTFWNDATLGKRDDTAIAAAVAKPALAPVRLATTYQLLGALTDAQRGAYPGPVKAWDQRMFSARDTPWPETNEKIGRIATALGTTPKAWFDAALNPPAS